MPVMSCIVCISCLNHIINISIIYPQELLCENPVHVDGTKIEKIGFQYEYPQLTVSLVKEVRHLKSVVTCTTIHFADMHINSSPGIVGYQYPLLIVKATRVV